MIRRLLIACILLAGLGATAPNTFPMSIARACSGACVSTTTSLSSNVNPSFTSGAGSAFTLTATVTPLGGGTVTEGTVAFTTNGSGIPGCGSVAVSGGQATCSTSIASEGDNSIEADYTDSSSDFDASTGTMVQTVFNHTTVTGNTYCNSGAITIPNSTAGGPAPLAANPYPSEIFVGPSGTGGVPLNGGTAPEAGTISSVSLQVSGLSFSSPNALDLMLSGPNGANVDVMSNAGGTIAVSNVNLTLNDSAASLLPVSGPLPSGTYKPTSWSSSDTFPAPAPTFDRAIPTGVSSFATEFSSSSANGAWKLYAVTQNGAISGSISGGWCLSFTMSATAVRAGNFSYVRPGSRITFHWRVATRAGIAGFAILAEPRGGKARQLNHRLIPVHARYDYAFTARYGGPGPFRLQVISTSGQVLDSIGS